MTLDDRKAPNTALDLRKAILFNISISLNNVMCMVWNWIGFAIYNLAFRLLLLLDNIHNKGFWDSYSKQQRGAGTRSQAVEDKKRGRNACTIVRWVPLSLRHCNLAAQLKVMVDIFKRAFSFLLILSLDLCNCQILG